MSLLDKAIRRQVHKILLEYLHDVVIELKPESTYLLILPPDIPEKDIHDVFKEFPQKPKVYFLQAENVKLLELTKPNVQ